MRADSISDSAGIAFYNANKTYLSGKQIPTSGELKAIIPDDAVYMRATYRRRNQDFNALLIQYLINPLQMRYPQDKKDNFQRRNKKNVSTARELIDTIDSIATSIESNIADINNIYDIYLAPGHYSLYSEIDLSRVRNGDGLFQRGLEIPDYVNLIGDGNVLIDLTIPDEDNTEKKPLSAWMSTINVYGENTFEGITFVANNCKYCCHDDSMELFADKTIKFINCTFVHYGMDAFGATRIPQPFAYGAGFDSGRKAYFEKCIIKSISPTGRGLYIHTSPDNFLTEPCEAKLENCVIMAPEGNEAICFQVPWSIPIQNGGSLSINNCFFPNSKIIHLWGEKPITIFGGGNTEKLEIKNENDSNAYLVN